MAYNNITQSHNLALPLDLVRRRVISLKFCCMLACLKSTTILCVTLRHSRERKKKKIPSHIVRTLSQCDHSVSYIVVHVSGCYGVLCWSCCYFEEIPVVLTTGCQSLLSVILFRCSLDFVIAALLVVESLITENVWMFGRGSKCL